MAMVTCICFNIYSWNWNRGSSSLLAIKIELNLNIKDMTKEEVQKLKHGVYRLYWSARTYSLASVGSLHDGSRWFACANWTSKTDEGVTGSGDNWDSVVKAVLIESR